MRGGVVVTLLKTVILLDVVQHITTHNNGLVHLCADAATTQNAPTNGNISGPRALLVDVLATNSPIRSTEAQPNLGHVSSGLFSRLANGFSNSLTMLSILEDGWLLLIRTLVLKGGCVL